MPGGCTSAEYVCFVKPSGFVGRSFRRIGGGIRAAGSDALRALNISGKGFKSKPNETAQESYRRAALASFSAAVVSTFSS